MPTIYPPKGQVTLRTLLADNPSTQSLKRGDVGSDLIRFDFADIAVAHDGFKPFVRDGAFDCGELAIVTFLQARQFGKPLVLLPAVILGRFQHHCLAYNAEKGAVAPGDLEGKRIAVRSYTQTTGVWVRGILQNEYGVDPAKVHWVCFDDPHVAEYTDPAFVERAPKGKKPAQMLLDGEVDAAILGNDMPNDPRIHTVIPDPQNAALAWHAKTGVVPMNHMVAINADLSAQRPDVVRDLYRQFKESRDRDTPPKGGIEVRPFGLEAMRASLQAAIDYAHQQRIITDKPAVEDLFDDVTRTLD
ncbi:MAG: phosphate ABC transporter substrate-binding protein [Rhodobacteraceae bacterium]|nr:phosphate ABC transporter substrate-binding protein [Paracoccaceae bacterium]